MEPLNIRVQGDNDAIEAQGHKWLVYWTLSEDDPRCFMTSAAARIEVMNPHEWQAIYTEAGILVGDEASACDLACERLRWLLVQRNGSR